MQRALKISRKHGNQAWLPRILLGLVAAIATDCTPPPVTADGVNSTGELAVIVHSSNSIESLSEREIRHFFERKIKNWASGTKVVPVDLPAEDPYREVFSRAIFDSSADTVRKRWIAVGLQGGSRPPPMRSTARVIELVSRTRGAIGYVPTNRLKPNSSVKVVLKLNHP